MARRSRSRSTPSVAQRRRQAAITVAAFVIIGLVFAITWFINNSRDSSADDMRTAAASSTTKATKSKASKAATTTKTTTIRTTTTKTSRPKTSTARTATKTSRASKTSKTPAPASIPAHVTRTLAYIDAGEWPEAARAPGTKGGMTFRNNEGHLPATDANDRRITYREWDVNPKAPNRGRDAERIVTGSDGSAWYTADHYRSFIQIRGPS
ncbi:MULTISPECIES: ribonuclease domain-containing protein [Gordonia]|uniref:Ribonuclease domain-containing protein n=1 Tax=Gordonia amicalis TaxID=89053 RepID=A0ABU4DE24_9ACTN|nr:MULTISPECIES: ribonuclease domain-containing protein [Gordonia]ATD69340.1 ribonuclease N [Gordonia sp. 1D]KAF0971148.1 hypothetical protein BPODLACK_00331 [Gordonia sp. YY1]MCR8898335.1 ribonuclease N [Gordonia sp. GONU]MCZ0911316.1 ribonuclease N [Gordonia amicalis]MDJ0451940.1 ribonuclease domain-containing protein [Gordonia amicalis]